MSHTQGLTVDADINDRVAETADEEVNEKIILETFAGIF